MAITKARAEAIIEVIGKSNIKDLASQIDDGFDKASKSARRFDDTSASALDSVKGSWTELLSAVTLVSGAISQAREVMTEVGTLRAVEQTFDRMGGSLQRLRDAAAGTISDASIQKFAIQAERAGLAADDFARVLDVAARLAASGRGAASGITSTAGALEALMDSIVGASDSDLEKFGIIVDLPEEVKRFAAEMQIAKDDIDKAVESQAMLNIVTGRVAESVRDIQIADSELAQIQKMEAAWENAANKIKVAAFDIVTASAKVMGAGEKRTQAELDAAKAIDHQNTRTGASMATVYEYVDAIAAAESGIRAYQLSIDTTIPFLDGFETQLARLDKKHRDSAQAAKTHADSIEDIARAQWMLARATAIHDEREARRVEEILHRQRLQAEVEANEEAKRAARRRVSRRGSGQRGRGWDKGDLGDMARESFLAFENDSLGFGAGIDPDDLIDREVAKLDKHFAELERWRDRKKKWLEEDRRDAERLADEQRRLLEGMDAANRAIARAGFEAASAMLETAMADEARAIAEQTGRTFDEVAAGMDRTALSVVNAASVMVEQYSAVAATLREFEAAGLSSSDAMVKSAPSMIQATGAVVASFIEDQKGKAIVMAAMETAAAAAAFATYDYYGGAMHTLAATSYAIAAGTSPGSAGVGGARTAARQQRGALPNVAGPQQRGGGSYNVTIRMDGATIVGSDRRRVRRDFQQILTDAAAQSPQFNAA